MVGLKLEFDNIDSARTFIKETFYAYFFCTSKYLVSTFINNLECTAIMQGTGLPAVFLGKASNNN